MRPAALLALLPLVLAGCASSSGATQELAIATSDRAQDILGLSLLLSDMRDRRESTSLKAWSFTLTNNEGEAVKVRATPAFISPDGRDLGGSSDAQTVEILPGKSHEFYFKAPTGEVARLVVRFERR